MPWRWSVWRYFSGMSAVAEIVFHIEPCVETGGYVARWDAPRGGGITTQGDSFAELDAMIADALGGYFGPKQQLEYRLTRRPKARSFRPCDK